MEPIRRDRARETEAERWLRPALAVLALGQIAAGAVEAAAPHTFYRLARIGPFNEHFIRDLATTYIAFGIALLAAMGRPSWRVPVLAVGTLQYSLHLISHIVDIGKGHPGWVGPVNAALVAVGLAGFGLLMLVCWRNERLGGPARLPGER
jgi:hypothetical protein